MLYLEKVGTLLGVACEEPSVRTVENDDDSAAVKGRAWQQ